MAEMINYPAEVVLIRHGQSELNVRRAIALHSGDATDRLAEGLRDMDVTMTEEGYRQARQTGQALRDRAERFDVAFTSPYLRTRQTLDTIKEDLGYDIHINYEDRIREKEFGIISQYTNQGIRKHFPHEASRLELDGAYYYRPLGGESYPDIGLRLHSFLHSLYSHQAGKRVLVVSHAAVIVMLRKLIERFDEKSLLELDGLKDGTYEVKNCGVTTYHYDAELNYLKLHKFNEVFY